MKKFIPYILYALFVLSSCEKDLRYQNTLKDPNTFHKAVDRLTEVIVHDIFSPPVAARIYAYPSIAAYEAMYLKNPNQFKSLAGQLDGLSPINPPDSNQPIDFELVAIHAFLTLGKQFIFSENTLTEFQDSLYQDLRAKGMPKRIFQNSIDYGNMLAKHVQQWADQDLYKQTRTYPKYTIREEDEYWKPTPPAYMDGIEPHWNKIRTFVLDSANQFEPKPPIPFNLEKGSPFRAQLDEVYQVKINLTEEQTEIASFWDCNPYVTHQNGHAMFATKKITPGGHWIGITKIASINAKLDFASTINTYARVSIALFDAFISCWDTKWNTLVVRPETLINNYFDQEWMPLLQTPPFPEYTSGHSVISRASAVVLTDIFGDSFPFDDSTETDYGLPVRSYNSFLEAAEEAAISRLYGGIHYMMAIEEGVNQGQAVGDLVVSRLVTQLPTKTSAASVAAR